MRYRLVYTPYQPVPLIEIYHYRTVGSEKDYRYSKVIHDRN